MWKKIRNLPDKRHEIEPRNCKNVIDEWEWVCSFSWVVWFGWPLSRFIYKVFNVKVSGKPLPVNYIAFVVIVRHELCLCHINHADCIQTKLLLFSWRDFIDKFVLFILNEFLWIDLIYLMTNLFFSIEKPTNYVLNLSIGLNNLWA